MLFNQTDLASSSCIIPIKEFSEIQTATNVDEATLILLDIDNTLLSSAIDYGTIEHFFHLCKIVMEKDKLSAEAAKLANHEWWIRSQHLVPTKVIDEKSHAFIKEAKNNQATTIAFTARLPRMTEVTLQQLARHGFSFDILSDFNFKKIYQADLESLTTSCNQSLNSKEVYALFASGVVFCHDLNTKGEVFKDFFKAFGMYREAKGLPDINKVIFVDDGAYNFESMSQAVVDLGLTFCGFHFQYQNDFDLGRAILQEKMFVEADKRLSA